MVSALIMSRGVLPMGTSNIDNWGERFGAHDTIAPDSRRADAGSVLICVRQAVSLFVLSGGSVIFVRAVLRRNDRLTACRTEIRTLP